MYNYPTTHKKAKGRKCLRKSKRDSKRSRRGSTLSRRGSKRSRRGSTRSRRGSKRSRRGSTRSRTMKKKYKGGSPSCRGCTNNLNGGGVSFASILPQEFVNMYRSGKNNLLNLGNKFQGLEPLEPPYPTSQSKLVQNRRATHKLY